jgi:integrase/recombinase XerD
MQKTVRKYKCGESTGRRTKKILEALTLDEMFDKFMTFKKTEALATRFDYNYLRLHILIGSLFDIF